MVKQEHGRETAGSSQPDPLAKGRERSGGGGEAHTGNGTSYLKPQTLAPVTHLLPQGHTSKSFPTSSTEQGPGIQIYILLRAFSFKPPQSFHIKHPSRKCTTAWCTGQSGGGNFFQVPSSQMPLVPGTLTQQHSGTGHSSQNTHHSPSVLNDLHHLPPGSILECPKVLFLYHPCSFTSQLEHSNLCQPHYGPGKMTS